MSNDRGPRTSLADGIRMVLVTRRAEKGFLAMDPSDQELVADDLRRPILGNRYRKLQRWASVGLYHFDVTDSIRVTSVDVNGQACVVHVGTHPQFDRFVAQFDGRRPQNPKPLVDSRIMKTAPRMTPSKVPTLPSTKPASAPPASPPAPPPPGATVDAADGFNRFISQLFETAFAKERERLHDEVLQFAEAVTAAKAEANHGLSALTQQLAARGAETARLEATTAAASQAVAEQFCRVDANMAGLGGQLNKLGATFQRLQTAFTQTAAELNRKLDRTGSDVVTHHRRLEEVADAFGKSLSALEGDLIARRIAPVEGKCAGLSESLAGVQRVVVEHVEEYRHFALETIRERDSLRDSLADLRHRLTEMGDRIDAREREEAGAKRLAARRRGGFPLGVIRSLYGRLARIVSFGWAQ